MDLKSILKFIFFCIIYPVLSTICKLIILSPYIAIMLTLILASVYLVEGVPSEWEDGRYGGYSIGMFAVAVVGYLFGKPLAGFWEKLEWKYMAEKCNEYRHIASKTKLAKYTKKILGYIFKIFKYIAWGIMVFLGYSVALSVLLAPLVMIVLIILRLCGVI